MGAQAVRLSNVDIDNALKNKEFEVLFQPIFDLGNGALARVESFVRWRHPSLGVLPPGAFISFFETQGRMSELTRYVLAGALNAYDEWRGASAPGFSINLALSDLSDEAFVTHFAKVLRDRDFPPDLVTLECPMPPVDVDLDTASTHFAALADTGARLAIEVRGRANDLLRNIDPFPFDEIKTGGSAILRFARTVRGPGLSAIADLLDIANRSNAAITAVGVEDQASLSALRGLGFTAVQGNHLAKVGNLSDFRPGKVNDVRALLDLEPLSSDSLSALFRTGAPSPTPAEEAVEQSEDEDDASAKSDTAKQTEKSAATSAGAAKKAKVREKAKALALAKRAKARDARKAAAIDRAKAKMAHAKQKTKLAAQADQPAESAFPPPSAPRDLQAKLTKEFSGDAGHAELTEPTEAPLESDDSKNAAPDASDEKSASNEASPMTQKSTARTSEKVDSGPALKLSGIKDISAEKASDDAAENSDTKDDASGQPLAEDKISMAVGAARAHFRPGIRVGTPGLRTSDPTPIAPPVHESAPAAADLAPPPDAVPEATPDEATPDEAEPIAENLSPPEEATDAEAASAELQIDLDDDALVQGDLHNGPDEEQEVTVEAKPAKRRRKNFLTRRYQLMPTHFWPKSWKRALRQQAARRQAKEQTATDEDGLNAEQA